MTNKYVIFSVVFFGYAMFSYNRKGVSFTIPKLLEEGLQHDQVGFILSSQNLAYAISKFLGGIISDRVSSRLLFSTGLLLSGLAAIVFSMMDSVVLFASVWFLNGIAQGAGWPAIAKILKNWFKPDELGTWWSIASASANVSGCLAPFLSSFVILRFGWRFSLIFVGGLSVLAAVVSYLFIVDSPPSPKKRPSKKKSAKKDKSYLRILLSCKFIWVISICNLVISTVKTSVTDWSQMYLMLDCGQSSMVASTFVGAVELGGFCGAIAAGYISDYYMKNNPVGHQGHPRMIVATGFAALSSASLYTLHFHINKLTPAFYITQLGLLAGFSIYGQIAIYGVVATQSVANEMSGTAHAIVALAANSGSILAGLPLATIAKQYSWATVFYLLGVVTLVTLVFMVAASKVSYNHHKNTK